jgi:hypothetical protein
MKIMHTGEAASLESSNQYRARVAIKVIRQIAITNAITTTDRAKRSLMVPLAAPIGLAAPN